MNIINGGIYKIIIPNENKSKELNSIDEHPFLLINHENEKSLYCAIQLTTFTEKKWEYIKENGYGIYLKSINSIAKINKSVIIGVENIKHEFINKKSQNRLIISSEELKDLLKMFCDYISKSSQQCLLEHTQWVNRFKSQKDTLYNTVKALFVDMDLGIGLWWKNKDDGLLFAIPKNQYDLLEKNDILGIIKDIFEYRKVYINFNEKSNLFFININKDDKTYLTFKEKYDRMNVRLETDVS